jgi:2-furoyl-CoA dehydrogenase 2Fe-2S iron sulfur subunit
MMKLSGNQRHPVRLTVNGKIHTGEAEPRRLLSDFLRQDLGLPGTHVGCEHGVCGACTVLLDGKAVRSCTLYAVQLDGAELQTIEGLAHADGLSDLQEAFHRHHALQCGFCTPGILMSCQQFLTEVPNPSEDEVRHMLSGHICRCTGYEGIVRAILDVARTRTEI